MRSILRSMSALAALPVVFGACAAGDSVEPQLSESVLVHGQVRVTLDVEPERLAPPGTILVTLTYENLGSETVVLTSGYGCLSFASVYLGEDRVPFPATQYMCTTAVSYHDLEPDHPIVVEWPLAVGGEDGIAVGAGTYRFVADLQTHSFDLERRFTIE